MYVQRHHLPPTTTDDRHSSIASALLISCAILCRCLLLPLSPPLPLIRRRRRRRWPLAAAASALYVMCVIACWSLSWYCSCVDVKIRKVAGATKFKLRLSRYLYTLKVADQQKADKISQSFPPGTLTSSSHSHIHIFLYVYNSISRSHLLQLSTNMMIEYKA